MCEGYVEQRTKESYLFMISITDPSGLSMTQANGDSHDLPTSEQNTKYDRQLRLWGAHGQKALMESRILLINAGKRKFGIYPISTLADILDP